MKSIFELLQVGYVRPLTGEYILTYNEVCDVLKYIKENGTVFVLGGDVLNSKDRYIYANWSCEYSKALSMSENITNSCKKATEYIENLKQKREHHYIIVLDDRVRRK